MPNRHYLLLNEHSNVRLGFTPYTQMSHSVCSVTTNGSSAKLAFADGQKSPSCHFQETILFVLTEGRETDIAIEKQMESSVRHEMRPWVFVPIIEP